ncbi:bacteriocin-processing peptidase family protein [Bacillus clarus]|uniref:Bacteriocin-processing peptidase family protein n=1 Tax=Bacillus clarus TaxID=2338372 RepID=A0A090YYY9_9BACI|nr:bacteriocin-processing peptidase family protein [Bacillus clarus]KFN03140.1 tetratricopeptide repeat family protein [Bacillus clarus]RFT66661.1 bacteriocin-processing peptidase family protein [Bacillus clarus]
MIEFRRLETCLKEKRFVDGLQNINSEIAHIKEKNRLSYVKDWLSSVSSHEEFDTIIRLTDEGLMHQYSAFLIRYSYKRFPNVRTLSLYCDELIDDRKILDAEQLLKGSLEEISEKEIDADVLAKAHFTLVRCLLEMKRNEEAFEHMKKAEDYSTRPIFDKWGYFYIQTGEWEKAEQELIAGLKQEESEELSIYLLSQLYAYRGEQKRALQLINDAIEKFPQVPYFYFEKVKHLLDLQCYEKMLAVIDKINSILPYHSYKAYFTHLRAEALYKMSKVQELQALLKSEVSLKDSLYHNIEKKRDGKKVHVPLIPIVQKDNYCVPASLEMMLGLWGDKRTQDEVANYIFDVTGSKFSDTVTYLEELGYEYRYFKGNEENYKTLLDQGIPVLLSIDIEHASHVQVLSGYDDGLQAFIIQDPNFLEPLFVEYEKLQERYCYTDGLSIVFVPQDKKEQLSFLVEEENTYFKTLFSLTDHLGEQDKEGIEKLVVFLQETSENPYTWLYTIKHLDVEVNKEFILFCTEKLTKMFPDSDFVKLHSAQCFIRLQDMEKAEHMLQRVEKKNNQALYHFIRGRYSFEQEDYIEAISSFRSSLQLDTDQPVVWSFLALSYMYMDQSEQGIEYSKTAVERHPERFTLVNHGLILMDLERFEEAYHIFNDLLKEYKYEAHIWYERARCAHHLGKTYLAIKGLKVAIQLDKTAPYLYTKLSEIYESDLDDENGMKEILLQGIQNCEDRAPLYVRLGDLHFQNDELEEAEAIYKRSLEENNEDVYSHFGLIQVYMAKEQHEDAKNYIVSIEQQFEDNQDFLMNAGMVLWDAEIALGGNENELKLALSKLEHGIRSVYSNIASVLDEYVNRIKDTAFVQRGIAFLRTLEKEKTEVIEYGCYAGILYESIGQHDQAIKRYNDALKKKQDALPYFRIGETFMALGQFQEAKHAYEACLEMDENFIGVHLQLAEIYEKEENRLKEQSHMVQAMKEEPLHINMEYLVQLSVEMNLQEELLVELEKLTGEVPEIWRLDAIAYVYGAMNEVDKEKEYIEYAMKIDEEHVEVLYHYAKVLVKKHNAEAIGVALKVMQKDLESERIFDVYVKAMDQHKKLSKIRDALHTLKVKKVERSTAFMYAASAVAEMLGERQQNEQPKGSIFTRAFYRMKNRAKEISMVTIIIDLFELSLKLNAENSMAAQRLAIFYENATMNKEAIEVLQTSLENKWNYDVAKQLVNLFIECEEEEMLRDAFELTKQMVREQPDDYDTLLLQANVLFMIGEEQEAEKICLQLVEKTPFVSRGFLTLAKIYQSQSKFEEAIQLLEDASLHHPNETALRLSLAASYHQIGRTKKAEIITNEILSFDATDLLARYNRACYLAALSQNEEAKEELEIVLREDETGFFANIAEEDEDLAAVWVMIK